jgi:hypothetical protein
MPPNLSPLDGIRGPGKPVPDHYLVHPYFGHPYMAGSFPNRVILSIISFWCTASGISDIAVGLNLDTDNDSAIRKSKSSHAGQPAKGFSSNGRDQSS